MVTEDTGNLFSDPHKDGMLGVEPAETGAENADDRTSAVKAKRAGDSAPLAERLRPSSWSEFQAAPGFDRRLLAHLQAAKGKPPSMIFWGPPGSGKTTLARLVGESYRCVFEPFSAVLGGVKDVREIIDRASRRRQPTILFVDEIHRFNKSQQDAFLPHVESGAVVLIGATTENPSFSLTQALLSRVRVVVFPPLGDAELADVLDRGLATACIVLPPESKPILLRAAGGDARRLLNLVELLGKMERPDADVPIAIEQVEEALRSATFVYDRSGDHHYDLASAFIKSLRGSDPDAALYWGFRMLEGGEDPRFLCRRLVIFASEDVGNADPSALPMAVAAAAAYDRLGMPEGRIPISQCITYLATAEKSNRSYLAMNAALAAIAGHPRAEVPDHLRNAPTKLMESLGRGVGYQYPHDFPDGFAPGVQYLPDIAAAHVFYEPSEIGVEVEIAARQRRRRPSAR